MRKFQSLYLHPPIQTALDFRFVGLFEEKLNGLLNHCFRLFKCSSLTCDAELRAISDVPFSFFLDYRCQLW